MGLKFNITYWPIVHFKLIGNINDENFEEYKVYYLNLLIKCKKNKEKIILIADLNSNYDMPMKYIFKLALFNKKLFKFNKLYLNAVLIFSQSQSFKNLLKVYLSMITPSSPYKLCSSFEKINLYLTNNLNINFDANIFNLNNVNQNNIENYDDNNNDCSNKFDLYKKLNDENTNDIELMGDNDDNDNELNTEEINDLKI
jgi:hypothetical protein